MVYKTAKEVFCIRSQQSLYFEISGVKLRTSVEADQPCGKVGGV
jgi:hypothetical protein